MVKPGFHSHRSVSWCRGCKLTVLLFAMLGWRAVSCAQPQVATPQPDPLMQLMLSQPPIEVATNVEITAIMDPPVITVGASANYRVTISAVNDSIRWPDEIYAPLDLVIRQSARAQLLQPALGKLQPITTINHHVTATAPGTFEIPAFRIRVSDETLTVPATRLEVRPAGARTGHSAAPRLLVELARSNVFVGEPVTVRVLLPPSSSNTIQTLSQVQILGDGVMVDQSSARQRIQTQALNGRVGPTFIYEVHLTPLVAGRIELTAQGYTSGNRIAGTVVIQGQATIPGGLPQFILLDSDPAELFVEPLPRAGELPGFTGAIGAFTLGDVRLERGADAMVGDPIKLLVSFRSTNEIRRLVPPNPPNVTNWQVFPPAALGGPMLIATPNAVNSTMTFSYTLIPLTNDMKTTPEIPFCYFDLERREYVNLTIPGVPVRIVAGNATPEAQAIAQAAAAMKKEEKLKLSELAMSPGRTTGLIPIQLRSGFWWLQLIPVIGFGWLWWWDRRRRFFEEHPEVLVRRRARRALRRERAAVQTAARSGDPMRFATAAVSALRVGAAPHFPATPRALVGRDLLDLFESAEGNTRTAEVIRQLFASVDAAQFAANQLPAEVLGFRAELERIFDHLEHKLR